MSRKNTKKKDLVAIRSEIMTTTSSMVSFMKEQVTNNLVTAKNQGKIELSDEQLKKVCSYVDVSITSAFMKSSDQLENVINKI